MSAAMFFNSFLQSADTLWVSLLQDSLHSLDMLIKSPLA